MDISNESSVNIRHFLIIALGGNTYLHPFIEEMYNERKWEYYELFRNSPMYKDLLIARHVTANQEKMNQVAGIVAWCYEHNEFEKIYRLIKKGYKFSYQYVQQNKVVNLSKFEIAFLKRNGGVDQVTDLSLMYASIIVLYLCNLEKHPFELDQYGEMLLHGMQNLLIECFAKQLRFSDENREKYKIEVDELFAIYQIPRKMKPMPVGKIFELFIERQIREISEKNPFRSIQDIRRECFHIGISKYIGALSNWLKLNGIDEMDLTEHVIFTREDIEDIFLEFTLASQRNSNRIEQSDRDLYLISTLYIQTLARVYSDTKRLFLDDSQEYQYAEMKNKENDILEKERRIRSQEAAFKAMETQQHERIAQLEEELRKTQRALQQAQLELEKREDNSKEVASLREYVYELNNEVQVQQELSREDLLQRIQRRKIAVIGGDQNWINKMREVLPEVKFIEIESINRDLSYIDNLDAVFVYWSIFKHNFYKKFMKQMAQNDTQLHYLSRTTNVDLVLREMEKALRDKSK